MIAFARHFTAEPDPFCREQMEAQTEKDPDLDRESLRIWLWERAHELGGIFAELRARIFDIMSECGDVIDESALVQEDPELLQLRTKLVMLLAARDEPSRQMMQKFWKGKRSCEHKRPRR